MSRDTTINDIKGDQKKMSPLKIWKWPFDKNRLSEEVVLLTVWSTHEYIKLWEGEPPRTNGSC